MQATGSGKGDMLVVNRAGKGGLMMNAPAFQKKIKLGQLENN